MRTGTKSIVAHKFAAYFLSPDSSPDGAGVGKVACWNLYEDLVKQPELRYTRREGKAFFRDIRRALGIGVNKADLDKRFLSTRHTRHLKYVKFKASCEQNKPAFLEWIEVRLPELEDVNTTRLHPDASRLPLEVQNYYLADETPKRPGAAFGSHSDYAAVDSSPPAAKTMELQDGGVGDLTDVRAVDAHRLRMLRAKLGVPRYSDLGTAAVVTRAQMVDKKCSFAMRGLDEEDPLRLRFAPLLSCVEQVTVPREALAALLAKDSGRHLAALPAADAPPAAGHVPLHAGIDSVYGGAWRGLMHVHANTEQLLDIDQIQDSLFGAVHRFFLAGDQDVFVSHKEYLPVPEAVAFGRLPVADFCFGPRVQPEAWQSVTRGLSLPCRLPAGTGVVRPSAFSVEGIRARHAYEMASALHLQLLLRVREPCVAGFVMCGHCVQFFGLATVSGKNGRPEEGAGSTPYELRHVPLSPLLLMNSGADVVALGKFCVALNEFALRLRQAVASEGLHLELPALSLGGESSHVVEHTGSQGDRLKRKSVGDADSAITKVKRGRSQYNPEILDPRELSVATAGMYSYLNGGRPASNEQIGRMVTSEPTTGGEENVVGD